MPRYFFDITADGRSALDNAGVQVSTLQNAECHAVAAIAEMIVSEEPTGSPRSVHVTIRDDDRKSLTRLTLTVARSRV